MRVKRVDAPHEGTLKPHTRHEKDQAQQSDEIFLHEKPSDQEENAN